MTIAVAHHDSPRGKAALRMAAREAVLHNEPLRVLHIIPGVDKVKQNNPDVQADLQAELAEFSGLDWSLHTAPEEYDTAESLLTLADDVGASLLVLGSRKRRPIGKLLLGSVVQRVLLEAEIPVLVVKAR